MNVASRSPSVREACYSIKTPQQGAAGCVTSSQSTSDLSEHTRNLESPLYYSFIHIVPISRDAEKN